MLRISESGYYIYTSAKTGIEYDILEGFTVGGEKRYTSDVIFIMLSDPDYNVDNQVVGYLFGAHAFTNNPSYYVEAISEIVEEFEEKNGL